MITETLQPIEGISSETLSELERLGYSVEFQGGGCFILTAYRGEACASISYGDGCDLPSDDNWLCNVAREALGEAVASWRSDDAHKVSLAEAAAMAIAVAESLGK